MVLVETGEGRVFTICKQGSFYVYLADAPTLEQ